MSRTCQNLNAFITEKQLLRAHSFTSLMADQDINKISSFGRCSMMKHFLEGITPIESMITLTEMRLILNTIFSSELKHQSFNGVQYCLEKKFH